MLRTFFARVVDTILMIWAGDRADVNMTTATSTRTDLEESCDHQLLACAAGTAVDGAFTPQKIEICTMAATPDCSIIFHHRKTAFAETMHWHGRGHPALQRAGPIQMSSEGNAGYGMVWAGIFVVLLVVGVQVLRHRWRGGVSNPASLVREVVERELVEAVHRETGAASADRTDGDALNAEANQTLDGEDVGSEANLGGARRGASSSHMNSGSPVEQGFGLLIDADEVEESSIIPASLLPEGEGGRMRRWALTDLPASSATLIGGGMFGNVASVTLSIGVKVAVKVIPRFRDDLGHQDKYIDREIELLKECRAHPHIIHYFGRIKTESTVCMIMPMGAADLESMMIKDGPLDQATTQAFIPQVLSALEFLHDKRIVHRDIKAANVLVSDALTVVRRMACKTLLLADFGLAKKLSQGKECFQDAVGTKTYMAPELLGANNRRVQYDMKVDMWAVGVMTHELLTTQSPFSQPDQVVGDLTAHDLETDNIRSGRATFHASLAGTQSEAFITKLLEVDAEKRLSAFEASHHRWLGGASQAQEIRGMVSATMRAREAL